MKDTEELVNFLVQQLYHREYFYFQNRKIDVSLPWPSMTIKQAFKKWAGIQIDQKKK